MRPLIRPVPLVAALLVGLLAFCYVGLRPIPRPVLRAVGVGVSPLELKGGAVVEVTTSAAVSAERGDVGRALIARVRSLGGDATVSDLGDGRLAVTITDLIVSPGDTSAGWLVAPLRLELRPLVHGSPFMRELYAGAQGGAVDAQIRARAPS